jgi:hypothetical protein
MSVKIPIELAILGCCATLAAAQDLNIKPGLWEFAVTQEWNGDQMSVLPAKEKAQFEEAKARMSPEQRAQMEALMKQQQPNPWGGPAKTIIEKRCLTKEDIHQITHFAAKNSPGDKEASNCKITVLKSTATVIESREACSSTNGPNPNTTLLIEAPNPETMTFRAESKSSVGGSFEMKVKSSGKWLGPACGSVKP